jgi:hypothetical protein
MMSRSGDQDGSSALEAVGGPVQGAEGQYEVCWDSGPKSSCASSVERAKEMRDRLAPLELEQIYCSQQAELERLRPGEIATC